jgi:translocation and assembly module TamB
VKLRYWFAIAFGVIVVVIVAGGAVLLETQAGLDWALGVAENHTGGMISVGAARGRLAGPLTLKNVRITLSGATISAKQVRLDWSPSALVKGQVYVARLRGAHVTVRTRPSQKKKSSAGLPKKVHLPLHIVVKSARIKDIHVHTAKRQLELNRLALALDADNRRILLDKLEARGPRIALGGRLRLTAHDEWPVKARLAIILRPPKYPVVEGRTRLDGALRGTLTLQQTLHAPFSATLDAKAEHLFSRPQLNGKLRIASFDPRTIKSSWPNLKAAAALAFGGSLKSFGAHGTITLERQNTRRTIKLNLKGGAAKKRLRIARLDVALAHAPTRLALRGQIGLSAPHQADLEIAWRDLAWPLASAKPRIRAAAGGAHINGSLKAWTLHALTLLRAARLPQGRWALAAHGGKRSIAVDGLAGRWLGGRLAGKGKVNLTGGHGFHFTLNTHGLHTEAVAKQLHGRLGFTASTHGQLKPLRAHVQVTKLNGTLSGHPLTGAADLDWAKRNIVIHKLRLAAGPNRLKAEGRWGKTLNLDWRLHAPRLAALGSAFGGRLDAHGKLEGTSKSPRIRAQLGADKLRWKKLSIAEASARVDLNLAAHAPSTLDIHVKNFARGKVALNTLALTLSGPARAERFSLQLNGNQGDVRLSGIGQLEHQTWRGKLTRGTLKPKHAPEFALAAPAVLVLGRDRLKLGHSCWNDTAASAFCLAAASGANGWQAKVTLTHLPLALADAYLTKDVALRGTLNGKLTAAGGNGKLDIAADLRTGRGSVSRKVNGKKQSFAFTAAKLSAKINESTARAQLAMTPAAGGTLQADAKIPWRTHAEPTGRIHLVAHIPDLSGIGALSNAVSKVAGRLDADFTVSGSLAAPRFAGKARLSGVALTLNSFGTHVENSNLVVTGTGAGVRLSGKLNDGKGGRLALAGNLARAARAWALDVHVRGKNFRAADMPEARVRVSPALRIKLDRHRLGVTGSIAIPSAHIKPPHFAKSVAPSSDLVIVGREKKQAKPPLAVAAHLTIRLGKDVHFNGYGLAARVGGQITLDQKPRKLTTASGELKVLDGHYKAYGQNLTIRHGQILFSGGPIANPGLDIRAARRVGLVTAGLQVTGTLRNPHLRVFSNPPMSQSQALAYLLFGHGIQQNNGQENSVYQQAASAIGIAGGTYLTKSLTKHVGIDTVSVENASRYSNDSNQASLFLGKYLSPRLYVSYGVGIYEPINLLRIRYTLSRHWALEAESGTISGADILFNIAP